MKSFLIISTKRNILKDIQSCFIPESRFENIPDLDSAMILLRKKRCDLIFVDLEILNNGKQQGYSHQIQLFQQLYPTIEIIVIAPKEMIREAVKAVKAGASDYVTYPIDQEEIKYVTNIVQESQIIQGELDYLRDQFWAMDSLDFIYSKNPLMQTVFEKVKAVAPTKSTVLLTGETGTGKGVLAKVLHRQSNRRDSQFISVHCGAIPDSLLESELFGHEKGAFTGAVRRKLGKFEISRGGTIFLDEIGTITPSAQIKLLQVLHDGTFQRVGGEDVMQTDARIISATNVDLKKMCEEGSFRKDLYYRLNVFPINIPPLRDRIDDIKYLVEGFIKKLNRINMKNIQGIDPEVLETLKHYSWPGNIRELENLVERAYILETSTILSPENFPSELFDVKAILSMGQSNASPTLAEARKKGIENIERSYLRDLLSRNCGKIKDSALSAGITTRQLHKLMTKYKLQKEDFKPQSTLKPEQTPFIH